MPVCDDSEDCAGTERPLCAVDLVKAIYPTVKIPIDNLHCVQSQCMKTGMECPPGEACLPVALPYNSVPDVCVPACDAKHALPAELRLLARGFGPIFAVGLHPRSARFALRRGPGLFDR